ncbi:MAG: anti-sigma factor family protein [Pyrinomonadaceae bacterium]
MTEGVRESGRSCRRADVAAYVDGELDPSASAEFERHARECGPCAAALTEQKRLLCLLDVAFLGGSGDGALPLPKNFARVVTARAQSDMSGMRGGAEHRRAFLLCAALSAASFGLLGVTTFGEALAPAARVCRAVLSVASMFGGALVDAVAGALVILRAVGGHFIAEPQLTRAFTLALFACAVILLARLIMNYHRAGVSE